MKKIKILLLAAVLLVSGANLYAQDATVTFVSGKVEVQRGGKWVALQKGDSVAKSETISTGFQSEAKIKIIDSVMYLGPVTRITLEELSTQDQTDNVNIYLKTGTTRSQVKHVDNKRVNYQVHTAVAVASCRGTGWVADDSNNFFGTEGEFAVSAYDEAFAGMYDMAGVIVRANQAVNVSDTKAVSTVVNTVLKKAADVTNTVTTAGSIESEGGTGFDTDVAAAGSSDSGIGAGAGVDGTGAGNGNGAGTTNPTTDTGDVVVSIDFPQVE